MSVISEYSYLYQTVQWLLTYFSIAALSIYGFVKVFGESWIKGNIEKRLQKIRQEGAVQLEKLKADLSASQSEQNSIQQANREQLQSLRSQLVQFQNIRNDLLERRRLDAIDGIWLAVLAVDRFAIALQFAANLKIPEILDSSTGNNTEAQNLRDFGATLVKAAQIEKFEIDSKPAIHRLYVPEKVWSLFSAYSGLHAYAIVCLTALKFGQPSKLVKAPEDIMLEVKKLIPNYTDMIEKFGFSASKYYAEAIRQKLQQELIGELFADRSDEAVASRGARGIAMIEIEVQRAMLNLNFPEKFSADQPSAADSPVN